MAAAPSPSALYMSDLVTGLIAALARAGTPEALSARDNRLDRAFDRLFKEVKALASEHGLQVPFAIRTDPLHGDCPAFQEEIFEAAKRRLVSLDNPRFQIVRIKVSSYDAEAYLERLPGSPEMYERLAAKFLEYYRQAGTR